MTPSLYPSAGPQSIAQTMDLAFQIFQCSLARCLPYGALSMIAGQLANIYYLAAGKPIGHFGGGDPLWWALYGIGAVVSLFLWSAVLLRQEHMRRGEPTAAREELAEGVRRLPSLLILTLSALLAVLAGTLALIVPGLYLSVAVFPAWPVLMLEKRDPWAAIRRSLALVKGQWWHSSAILTVGFIVAIVFYFAVFVLLALALPLLGANDVAMFTAASAVVVIVLGAIGVPFYSAVLLALYEDLKARQAAQVER